MVPRKHWVRKATTAILVFLAFGILASCKDRGPDRSINVVLPNGRTITPELAISDEEKARGLMFREKILPDQGMLFVFGREDFYPVWMKNTLISLDILWLDGHQRVIHIEAFAPPCKGDPCPSYLPPVPAVYVLELESGATEKNGIRPGDRLHFVLPDRVRNNVR